MSAGALEFRASRVAVANIGIGVSAQPFTAKLGSQVGVYGWHVKHALAASLRAVRAALPSRKPFGYHVKLLLGGVLSEVC